MLDKFFDKKNQKQAAKQDKSFNRRTKDKGKVIVEEIDSDSEENNEDE